MLNILHRCTLFTQVYSLLFARFLHLVCSFSHALLLSNAHSLPTYHSMRPCDPFHTGHFILTSCFCFLLALCTLPNLGTLPSLIVHPALCIFTICNTILVWGILVAHHTLFAHRCSLYDVQSQFSSAHHFIPNYVLLPDTHSLLYMPLFTMYTCHFVHISCFVYTFVLVHAHYPTYTLHSCSLLFHSD